MDAGVDPADYTRAVPDFVQLDLLGPPPAAAVEAEAPADALLATTLLAVAMATQEPVVARAERDKGPVDGLYRHVHSGDDSLLTHLIRDGNVEQGSRGS